MASKLVAICALVILVLVVVPSQFGSLAFGFVDVSSDKYISPEILCHSTAHPSFCKSVLPAQNATVYDYSRISVRKALSQAHEFLGLVKRQLQRRSSLSAATVAALEDCETYTDLNVDFLSSSLETMNKTNEALSNFEVNTVQNLLTSVNTNQETCMDGLTTTGIVTNDISAPLSENAKLYRVSLGLFTKAWAPQRKTIFHPMQKQHLPDGVWPKVIGSVTVRKDGTGNFTTINEAVSAAPDKSEDGCYFVIYVSEDVYEENVIIGKKKKNIMMIGAGIYKTVITGSRNRADGPWKKNADTATFSVIGLGFVGVNMTIRNTAGPWKEQAIALHNGADLSAFYKCSFEAYQDTLFTHSNRQFYRECDIYGTVDFIFGNAAVILQKCNIYVRKPLNTQFNAIAASGRKDEHELSGIVIQNCKIRAADDLVSNMNGTKSYLGRPWKEYATTVYMQNDIGGFIDKEGWHNWNGDFALKTLYYAEFNNYGDGSYTNLRVTWPGYHVVTNPSDVAYFTVDSFIYGGWWLGTTGVAYDASFV